MKCLIFSDSHGSLMTMLKAIERNPDAEVVFFLGDGLADLAMIRSRYPAIAFIAVRGNCDYDAFGDSFDAKKVETITLMGKRIVLTHGDLYSVKSGLGALVYLARETEADVMLYGHTHVPVEQYVSEFEKPFYLFNPGSASMRTAEFGIMTLYAGQPPLLSHGRI